MVVVELSHLCHLFEAMICFITGHVFEREREELKEKYEEQIQLLQQQLDQLQEKLEEERESLAQRFEGDREAIEEQLAQQIREELEVDLLC